MTTITTATWFTPVIITRGRKFRGFGYSLPGNPEFCNVAVWVPVTKETVYINPSYFERANVTQEQYDREMAEFIDFRINGTMNWCKTQKPDENENEIRSFARNVIKKHNAYLLSMFDELFPMKDDVDTLRQTITSVCRWADKLVTKPGLMYGHWIPGGKPVSRERKVSAAHKACENKGLLADPKFEAAFAEISSRLIH